MASTNPGTPVSGGEAREHYASLVGEFARAWERGLPGAMAEVFTVEGVLVPSPFDAPVMGRSAIAQYWREVPLEQGDVSFRFGEIFVAGPWFSTEFKCAFRRLRTGDDMEITGGMFCETSGGKISEMRMYWHRARTGGR
ncbi:MAG: nuclear transport factor 2 family protein [Gemmatimonadetes bacterium]|nr:nuclear transport factor 2 family protein [Gemmatimonadota bacterium]